MFTPNFYIDQFQATKKIVADQIFKDQPELRDVAINYVDSQTQFAKMIVDNTVAVNKFFWDNVTSLGYPSKKGSQ
jgi:hypothetical protein